MKYLSSLVLFFEKVLMKPSETTVFIKVPTILVKIPVQGNKRTVIL